MAEGDAGPTAPVRSGDDPVGGDSPYRRHMDASQRAMVAAKMANMTQGNFSKAASLPVSPVTQQQAASLMNVSERAVRSAKAIEKAAPEIAERVVAGDISVHAAKRVAAQARKTPPPLDGGACVPRSFRLLGQTSDDHHAKRFRLTF